MTCDDKFVGTITDGEKGDSGDGCTATALAATEVHKNGGVKITCGTNSYDLWNGENGKSAYELAETDMTPEEWLASLKGDQGETGAGCTLVDDENGSVTCGTGEDKTSTTLYKAVCGTEPYDPAKKFCSEGELYSCNDKPYDPKMPFCDTRDFQVYKFVTIGTQVWMAENLNYSVNPGEQSWCGGGESGTINEGDCSKYGRLYTWAAAVGKTEGGCGMGHECSLTPPVKGVCPEGWHLPSYQEFETLINVADPSFGTGSGIRFSESAGTMLKSENGWEDYDGVSAGTDAYGFTALPAGFRDIGNFYSAGCNALFWSASELDSYGAYRMSLGYGSDNALLRNRDKYYGFSVRCLQN